MVRAELSVRMRQCGFSGGRSRRRDRRRARARQHEPGKICWANRAGRAAFIPPRADSSIFCWTTAGTCPRAVDARWFGALIPDAGRFPGGPEAPWERLSWLNPASRRAGVGSACGWRRRKRPPSPPRAGEAAGALLGGADDMERTRGRRILESGLGRARAGLAFRARLTRWARQYAPHLTIEHAVCQGPVNDEFAGGQTDGCAANSPARRPISSWKRTWCARTTSSSRCPRRKRWSASARCSTRWKAARPTAAR